MSPEFSSDCIHDWNVRENGKAVCLKCGYQARGSSYKRWWKLYKDINWRERPYCLNCREPTKFYGGLCRRCRNQPQIEVPPPPSQAQQAQAWAKVDRMAEERRKDEAKLLAEKQNS